MTKKTIQRGILRNKQIKRTRWHPEQYTSIPLERKEKEIEEWKTGKANKTNFRLKVYHTNNFLKSKWSKYIK